MTPAPQTPPEYAADLVAADPGINTLDLFIQLRGAYPELTEQESADIALDTRDTTRPAPEA